MRRRASEVECTHAPTCAVDEESEWNKTIRELHGSTKSGLTSQLDFTATPRHSKGQLFSWTIYDYPLKQAIIDNVVKRPLKGIASGITWSLK